MNQVGQQKASLTKVALLGTERNSVSLPKDRGKLGTLLEKIPVGSKEGQLLLSFVTLSLYESAGQVSLQTEKRPEPLDLEKTNDLFCSFSAINGLKQILQESNYNWLLPEWLELCQTAKQVVHPEILPELLSEGKKNPELQQKIIPLIGTSGRYIAQKNPQWSYVKGKVALQKEKVEHLWQTEGKDARMVLLQTLRDTNPVIARELVQSTWKEDSPEERAKFLEIFEVNISMEDEPFLEQALDDKRKEVRTVAQTLLAHLPDSQLVKRMIERLTPLLSWNGKKVEVSLPSECTKAMIRDGVEPKVPSYLKKGEKGYWLEQMLNVVPPSYWAQIWNVTPKELLLGLEKTDWKKQILESWTHSLQEQKVSDEQWIMAIVRVDHDAKGGLYPLLAQERKEEILLNQLSIKDKEDISKQEITKLWNDIENLSFSHSLQVHVARALLIWLKKAVSYSKQDFNQRYWTIGSIIGSLTGLVPVSLLAEATQGWSLPLEQKDAWKEDFDRFFKQIEFRAELYRSFQVSTST